MISNIVLYYCVYSFHLEMLNLMDLIQVDQKSRITFITKQAAGD